MQVEQQLNEGKKLDSIKNQVRKAEEVHKYNNDELIQRCQKFFDSYKMQYQKDSANHYLSQCIRLDSTNVELINETGNYAREYLADYAKANYYYNKGLDLAKKQEETPGYLVATCYNNLGNIHYDKGEYDLALDCYKKAIEIKESFIIYTLPAGLTEAPAA